MNGLLENNKLNLATTKAFNHPKAGDRFSEMCRFWVHVESVCDCGKVTVIEYASDKDGKLLEFSNTEDFKKKYSYGNIPGYYVSYLDSDFSWKKNRNIS